MRRDSGPAPEEWVSSCGFAIAPCLSAPAEAHLPSACQGVLANADTRQVSACHCEPVRTLVRQSVLLAVGRDGEQCLRRMGKAVNLLRESIVAYADRCIFLHVIARSEATWQSVLLAVIPNEKQLFPANTQLLRIRPKYCQLAKFPCGVTDCRTSVRTGSQ